MAVPVIPILKKAATVLASDKKGRKVLLGILAGVLVIAMLPIAILYTVLSTPLPIGNDQILSKIEEKGDATWGLITEKMNENGCSDKQLEKAQALYVFALFAYSDDETLPEKLANCFLDNQTDTALIETVNTTFGTDISQDFFQLTGGTNEETKT